jgi:hypothetical protein
MKAWRIIELGSSLEDHRAWIPFAYSFVSSFLMMLVANRIMYYGSTGLPIQVIYDLSSLFIGQVPAVTFSILISAFLLRDATEHGLTPALPIAAIVVAASTILVSIVEIGLTMAGILVDMILPLWQIVSILWGIQFLLVRRSIDHENR